MAKKKATKKAAKAKKAAPKAAAKKSAPKKAVRALRKAAAPKAKASSKGFQLSSLAPSLTVNDVNQSMAWYTDVLGFTVGQRWERDGALHGAELKAGDVVVYLSQEDGAKGERVKGEGFRLYWYTNQNIDKIADGIKARGGTLASEPKDEWGVRAFSIVDPTGYKITISSDR